MGQWIELKAPDGLTVTAWQASPTGRARGAVVVLQEIFGVNPHIRAVTDAYAAAGWLALAPATFQRVRPGVELGYTPGDIQVGIGLKATAEALPAPGVLQDVQAAIDHAAQAAGGKVGVVGFCWGGLLTWRAACLLERLAAAVPYYGGGMTQPQELARQPRVPVLAHLSDRDQSVPMEGVQRLREAHPEVEVHVYPAQHGFNCDQRPAWDASSASLARERTLDFFARHLG